MKAAAVLAALLACGCASPPAGPEPRTHATGATNGATAPAGTTTTASAPSTTASTTTASTTASSSASTCAGLTSQFDALLAATPGACKVNTDCACYADLRIDGKLGVTDAAAAPRLQALSDEYRKGKCPTIFASSAAPPQCAARCDAGTCR